MNSKEDSLRADLPWTGERVVTSILTELVAEHLSRYAFAIDFCKGKKVLDAACGEGYGTDMLSGFATSITGVDIDKDVIRHAISKYQSKNVHFVTSDVCKMPFLDQAFDVIVSFETLEHVDSHEDLLNEFKRLLTPGGVLIISTPDKQHYSIDKKFSNPYHKKELFAKEFEDLLGSYFLHTELYCQQNFLGSVIYSMNPQQMFSLTPINKYEGSFSGIKNDESLSKPLYRVGLASDSALPKLEGVFFQDKQILNKTSAQMERFYRNTSSFKLGNAIIAPLYKLKNCFKKKK